MTTIIVRVNKLIAFELHEIFDYAWPLILEGSVYQNNYDLWINIYKSTLSMSRLAGLEIMPNRSAQSSLPLSCTSSSTKSVLR